MKKIGYSEFIRICQIDGCVSAWCDWLSIRADGVYIKVPDESLGLTPEERAVLTEHPIGDLTKPALSFPCDFASLMAFLEQQAIGIEIDDAQVEELLGDANTAQAIKPKSASQAQDEAILSVLRARGYDPMALPPFEQGRPGVKAEVRTELGSKGMWAGTTVFKKAWERLTRNGDIAYRE